MRSTLTQAILAAFCAILCNLSALGGGGMMLGARTACWSGGGSADHEAQYLEFVGSQSPIVTDITILCRYWIELDFFADFNATIAGGGGNRYVRIIKGNPSLTYELRAQHSYGTPYVQALWAYGGGQVQCDSQFDQLGFVNAKINKDPYGVEAFSKTAGTRQSGNRNMGVLEICSYADVVADITKRVKTITVHDEDDSVVARLVPWCKGGEGVFVDEIGGGEYRSGSDVPAVAGPPA